MSAIYDRIATRYDRLHRRWLSWAGGEAQAALEAVVLSRLERGMTVLDAGCGTGRLARHLSQVAAPVDLELVDSSREMLRRCGDLAYPSRVADIMDLPHEDGRFDLVVAAWSIEATKDPYAALSELLRVLRPGGFLVVSFCSDCPVSGIGRLFRALVRLRGTGRFLSADRVVAAAEHGGATATIRHRVAGPAATISFRKSYAHPVGLLAA